MDTKLKKMRKFKNLILVLVVILPSVILTSLYPLMEQAMLDKKKQWITGWEEEKKTIRERDG